MALIAFIQSYPYEADYGGDPEYIHRLARRLKRRGHDCHFRVTDMTRGRSMPFFRSPYAIESYSSYRMRNGVRIGRVVACLDPRFSLRVLARKLGTQMAATQPGASEFSEVEVAWIRKELRDLGFQVAVLCFGAVRMAPMLRDSGPRIIGLPSIIPGRTLGLGQDTDAIPEWFLDAARACDVIAANIDDDARALAQALPGADVVVVGMGSTAQFAELELMDGGQRLLFVGNDTPFNRSGIAWFLAEAWPRIIADLPSARLRVVGRVVQSLGPVPKGVEAVGPVGDLAAEYRKAQVVVAPLIEGTASVKTKVAEAISFGRAIVTTRVGVDPAHPNQLDLAGFVADDGNTFADRAIELLRDPVLLAEKSRGARVVFERFFSEDAAYGAVEERIRRFEEIRKR
ncbi:glycosyltransferase family 4 protein [Roseomonas sp. HF4]|uniref:glycosyltransferase family 4 protein n=1 Tax=Roseomonas sp. HF4 TaxID=2562313 RepID=UPI0010C00E9A|nr:glycosyltransferase family 4 protein [Roseomonas sp. HF4]